MNDGIDLNDYPDVVEAVRIYFAFRFLKIAVSALSSVIMSGKTGSMSLTSPPMAAGSTPAPDTKAVECT